MPRRGLPVLLECHDPISADDVSHYVVRRELDHSDLRAERDVGANQSRELWTGRSGGQIAAHLAADHELGRTLGTHGSFSVLQRRLLKEKRGPKPPFETDQPPFRSPLREADLDLV